MGGTAMAVPRWNRDPWLYRDRVFVGSVLDVGGTGDPLGRYRAYFPNLTSVTVLDMATSSGQGVDAWITGDASQPTGTFDCVYSSHCLEHVNGPEATMQAWWDAVRPGGYLVVIVPSWHHYEREVWPPRFNTDHRTSWVMRLEPGDPSHHRGLLDLSPRGGRIISARTLDAGFVPGPIDQTADHLCESGLELVVQK